jgi:hypothetical protein
MRRVVVSVGDRVIGPGAIVGSVYATCREARLVVLKLFRNDVLKLRIGAESHTGSTASDFPFKPLCEMITSNSDDKGN